MSGGLLRHVVMAFWGTLPPCLTPSCRPVCCCRRVTVVPVSPSPLVPDPHRSAPSVHPSRRLMGAFLLPDLSAVRHSPPRAINGLFVCKHLAPSSGPSITSEGKGQRDGRRGRGQGSGASGQRGWGWRPTSGTPFLFLGGDGAAFVDPADPRLGFPECRGPARVRHKVGS